MTWEVSITNEAGKTEVFNWKVETHYADWLARFEPLNGSRTAEDKFLPVAGEKYTVNVKVVGTDGNTYTNKAPVTITFAEDAIIDVNPAVVPNAFKKDEPADKPIAVETDIYGDTGTEAWDGSPNAANDNVEKETQILLCPENPAIVADGLVYEITITDPAGKYATFNWAVESHYADWLVRFEPLNGNRTSADKFLPEAGVEYKVEYKVVVDGKTYVSAAPVTITFDEAAIVNVNPDVAPVVLTGDATAIIMVIAIVALLGTAVVVSKKVFSK